MNEIQNLKISRYLNEELGRILKQYILAYTSKT